MKDQGDVQGRQFLHLMRLTYATVNLIPGSSTLSTQINQVLFNTLTSTTLVFLAGVWTDSRQGGEIDCLRYTSLRHAGAFIKPHQSDHECYGERSLVTVLQPSGKSKSYLDAAFS